MEGIVVKIRVTLPPSGSLVQVDQFILHATVYSKLTLMKNPALLIVFEDDWRELVVAPIQGVPDGRSIAPFRSIDLYNPLTDGATVYLQVKALSLIVGPLHCSAQDVLSAGTILRRAARRNPRSVKLPGNENWEYGIQ